ncbi:tripartite tricarboxylate transporter TctB family protein [Roseomonas sp. AR75]|uniref:tripartite tricarboxylate transporter TctB family protein n=1 Tax=Roseomonas sp. AR75 TaxID=2562311 RepID=UPI0010C0CE50|nr:tripartite tricarboxylate transporter TctB family protein [Roseomonas sp. AR75]
MRAARNPNHAIAAAVAAVAAAAFAGTFWFDPVPEGLPGLGAVDFPRLVCVLLFLLAGLLALKQGSRPSEEEAPPLDRGAWLIFGACLVFLPAMEVLGIWGAIPIFLVATGLIWGEVPLRTLVLNAIGLTVALWVVFVRIFQLTLPSGWLGAMLGR